MKMMLRRQRIRKCWMIKSIGTISFVGLISRERSLGFEISTIISRGRHRRIFSHLSKPHFFDISRICLSADDSTSLDNSYWETLYGQAGSATRAMDGPNDNILLLNPLQPCEVRVVTFDLDNTLWKTGPTIAMANDALAGFLIQKGIACPVRVEKVMNELFLATPSIYTPLDCKAPLSPVLLTNLRKDAIRSVLETHNSNLTDSAVTALVDEAFGVWTRTRHESIAQHLAVSAAACLQRIREMTTSQGKTVVIGAITDGNSDPKAVAALQEYFDFCVNAERVGVSKPDKRMYLEAMRQVASQPVLGDLFQNLKSGQTHEEENETLENAMGPWWVHVGDDFVKDVVAAKSLKLRTIWSRELVPSQQESSSMSSSDASSKSVEDFVKQVSEMKVIEMSVGADDYLANAITGEFADAIVDKFIDVAQVLRQWQSEALVRHERQQAGEIIKTNGVTEKDTSTDGVQPQIVHQENFGSRDMKPLSGPTNEIEMKVESKFCVYCGNKLPLTAKFCFACGDKQPDLQAK